MTRIIDPEKTIHLAIDVQTEFVGSLASGKRRKNFPAAVQAFAGELRERQIATIWVAASDKEHTFGLFADTLTRHLVLPSLELAITPKRDELIFVKEWNDAFRDSSLKTVLSGRNISDIILTGISTRVCMNSSLRGALREGFHCHVIPELCADIGAYRWHDKDPEWHQLQLEKRDQPRLAFYERQAFLVGLNSAVPPKAKALITDTLYPRPVFAS